MSSSAPRVAIIGTGVIGAMAAWRLAAAGAEVLAFDSYAPGHDRGASAGESRIFRTVAKEGDPYIPLLRRALPLWRELEQSSGRTLLTLCGGVTIGPPEHPDLVATLAAARGHGLDHEVLDDSALARRFPQHRPDPGEIGVFDPVAGVIRPEPAVQSALAAAASLGARVLSYHPVRELTPTATGWRLRAAESVFTIDHIVLCPGPWAPAFAELAGFPVQARLLTAAWFAARDVRLHQPDRLPIAIRRHRDAGFSCFPALDGVSVKILPHHLSFPSLDSPLELPRGRDVEWVRAAAAAVDRLLPGLVPSPIRVATYAEGFTPDDHPIVGPLPGVDNATVLTGFSGHGFKLSPVYGEIAAELVLNGKSNDPINELKPERFTRRVPA
jgi:sarcosine oxidase